MVQIAYHPQYIHPVRAGHRFPMEKYELIPLQLLHEGLVEGRHFFRPDPVDKATILLAHGSVYVEELLSLRLGAAMIRRIGFPLTEALVQRELLLVGGTVQGAVQACSEGLSFNIAGGTHHAGRDFGEGFCLLNDQAIAAAYLIDQHLASKVLILDLDVHQGNGTADIFRNHPQVFTFSMHSANNYPFLKASSDEDLPLADGLTDAVYLDLLQMKLPELFESVKPDFVFYQSGVDVLATDKLGKLKLSKEGCYQRDLLVFEQCRRFNVAVQVSMGGGYSVQLKDIVNAHVNTFRAAFAALDVDH